jgi:hypothetical protein
MKRSDTQEAKDLAWYKAEQRAGRIPPPKSRSVIATNKRRAINAKSQMKAQHAGDKLDLYVAYLLDRLRMARELQAERDNL